LRRELFLYDLLCLLLRLQKRAYFQPAWPVLLALEDFRPVHNYKHRERKDQHASCVSMFLSADPEYIQQLSQQHQRQ
jgi:hypothetical protein